MKHRTSRHSRHPVPAQLRQLLPCPGIHIHEPIHVADAELELSVRGLGLPVRPQDRDPTARLVIVGDYGGGGEGLEGLARGWQGRCGGEMVDFDGVVVRTWGWGGRVSMELSAYTYAWNLLNK